MTSLGWNEMKMSIVQMRKSDTPWIRVSWDEEKYTQHGGAHK